MFSLIEDLLDPSSLPDETKSVSLIQTHISMVFLGDEFVYKIKKPVNFGFLDFLTLEKRAYYCEKELQLNRRLAKEIYLEVLPITFDGKRHSMRSRAGKVVEYAVRMRRIPDEILMKSVFERGELKKRHLIRIAQVLARFHVTALRSDEIDEFGEPHRFKVNTDENFEQVARYVSVTITKKEFETITDWTNRFYRSRNSLFMKRVRDGKIRDCHGDLHMEHVCLTRNLPIIDCIEFNDRFRYSDTLADIAFLLMDLEYHGGQSPSKILWDEYKTLTGEGNVEDLLTFYKVYRAFVRGKVNGFQVDDKAIGPEKKKEALQRAKAYFRLATSYIE